MSEKGLLPLTLVAQPDARWELVQRVADSDYFRKGPKLRAFLLYVCENTILGRAENVREQLIGSKVFGRLADYDFNNDNIVRVEARELRKRLETYFANEGKDEAVVIEIPKGAYVPIFRPREEAAAQPAGPEPEEPAEAAVTPVLTTRRASRWLAPIVAMGLLAWAAATVWLATENRRLRQMPNPSSADAGASLQEYSIYPELLGTLGKLPNREPQLVLCNPKVMLLFGSETANPYVGPPGILMVPPKDLERTLSFAFNGWDRDMPYHFLRVTRDEYTGMGEAMAALQLARLMDALHRPVHPTQARFLNWDNVQEQDLILLGGPSSNDWTYQVDAAADFDISGLDVVNLRPLAGEPKQYTPDAAPRSRGELVEYGILKMLTTRHGFKTFLLAGLSGAGTAGVADFFATPAKMKPLAERIAAAVPGKPFPADWEVIIRIVVKDGLPLESSAVTIRPVPLAARQ
jgi:hypothetical protein